MSSIIQWVRTRCRKLRGLLKGSSKETGQHVKFLVVQHTPHSVTQRSHAEMLMGCSLTAAFDHLHPHCSRDIGEGPEWVTGETVDITSPLVCKCKLKMVNIMWTIWTTEQPAYKWRFWKQELNLTTVSLRSYSLPKFKDHGTRSFFPREHSNGQCAWGVGG